MFLGTCYYVIMLLINIMRIQFHQRRTCSATELQSQTAQAWSQWFCVATTKCSKMRQIPSIQATSYKTRNTMFLQPQAGAPEAEQSQLFDRLRLRQTSPKSFQCARSYAVLPRLRQHSCFWGFGAPPCKMIVIFTVIYYSFCCSQLLSSSARPAHTYKLFDQWFVAVLPNFSRA